MKKSEKITFNKGCEEWLALKRNLIKESSYLNYKFKINKYLRPDLGKKTLERLSKYDMNKYIAKLSSREDISDNTIKDCVLFLKAIFKFAKKKYKIDFDLDFNFRLNNNINELEVFNDYENEILKNYVLSSKKITDLGVLISLYSGLRIGEVCGLKWGDMDFENRVIYVKRTVQRLYFGEKKSEIIVSTPKSKKSIRQIPLSKILYKKMKPLRKFFSNEDYIITGLHNKYTEPHVYRYTYKNMLKECKIPYRKYHCLRHTFATRCIRVGMDVKSLSEVLGHASIGITLDTYVHSSYETKKKYIDKL